MCIRTILAKVTLLLLLEVLAHLCLVVVVRDVQHLILDLNWELLQEREAKRRKLIRVSGIWGEFEKESSIITLYKSADISNEIQTDRWRATYKTVTCGTALTEMPICYHCICCLMASDGRGLASMERNFEI